MKRCCRPDCTETNPRFHRNKTAKDGLSPECITCRLTYMQGYYDRNTEKIKIQVKTNKRKRMGLTHETFDALLESQGGCCAICRADRPGGKGDWHTDHDHACCAGGRSCGKCVRGLLCSKCNQALGLMHDDVTILQNAIGYLRRTEQLSNFNIGEVVVHKSLGSQPLVVTQVLVTGRVVVSFATQGNEGLRFRESTFLPDELETPVQSIEREAEIFKALNAKRDEINSGKTPGPVGISHLN